jgi:hypothetical protein
LAGDGLEECVIENNFIFPGKVIHPPDDTES